MTFLQRLDFLLVNPIAIKELRQAVRGKFVVATLILSLVGFVLAISAFVLSQQLDSTSIEHVAVGSTAFASLYTVLFVACLMFVPLYCGLRMMSERSDTNVDLLFVTALRPRTIIIGKLQAAAALAMLLYSAALPFLVFCYVLRGIDFVTVLLFAMAGFLVIMSACASALFIGALPTSKPFKLLLGIAFFIGIMFFYTPMIAFGAQLFGAGVTTSSDIIERSLAFGGVLLTIDVVLIFLTTALIAPAASNRALPIRVLMTVLCVASFPFALSVALHSSSTFALSFWAVLWLGVASLVLVSAVGEREEWGRRVARSIPTKPPLRMLAFLFYSGGGGVLWSLLMMAATIATYSIAASRVHTLAITDTFEITRWMVEGTICMIAYAFTALLVRRRLLADRLLPKFTWSIALGLFIFGAVLPPLLCMMLFSRTPQFNTYFEYATLFNPFPMTDAGPRLGRIAILMLWTILVVVPNAAWMRELLVRFRHADAPEPAPA